MSEWKAKRFWTDATVEAIDGGYTVRLDGRAVKTPSKSSLVLPTEALADAIAAEWQAQEDEINPLSMPFTRSANSAIDRVATQFEEVASMLAGYGDTDLLCYRAAHPEELVARQAEAWDPLLEWAAAALGARLVPRTGLMHDAQSPEALQRLGEAVSAHSAFELTGLHDLVGLSGSLVIGLAVSHGQIEAEDAWPLSRVDEDWQAEQWGRDEEADRAAAVKRAEFLHARNFLRASLVKTS